MEQQSNEQNPWEINWNDGVQALKDASNETPASLGAVVSAAAMPWQQDFGGKRELGPPPVLGAQPQQQDLSQAQPFDFNTVFSKLVNTESRGQHVDAQGNLLQSSKGAQGITQVLPNTGKDPGYGITPIQNNSQEEYVRFGRDYLKAMLNQFGGNTEQAVAAYNWGPGNVAKAIKKYGDQWLASAPAETKKYVRRILG